MAKHTYKVIVKDGDLLCFQDDIQVHDWCVLNGERMSEHKLFVNGVGVATLDKVEFDGIDAEAVIKGFPKGKGWSVFVVSNEKTIDDKTGEVTFTAKRLNGDIVITVLDKDGYRVEEKCRVIKAK